MMLRFSEEEFEAYQRKRALAVPERSTAREFDATAALIPPAPEKPASGPEIVLPWPPRELSPNARVHWRVRSKAAKEYRAACAALCRQAGLVAVDCDPIILLLEFVPPDRRRRDDDNLIASFKAGRDGIADAIDVDDGRFVVVSTVSDAVGGMVRAKMARSAWRNGMWVAA